MGCITHKTHKRDIQLELKLTHSIYEIGTTLSGQVIFTIYSMERLHTPPTLKLIGVEKVQIPSAKEKKSIFLEKKIELRGAPISWDVGIYTLNFAHDIQRNIPSSFKHKIAEITYMLQLQCESLVVNKEVLLIKPRIIDYFYSQIHGKRQFENKRGKNKEPSIVSLQTRLERNTFTKNDIIKGFASLDCSQCDQDLKFLRIELIQEIIIPSKIKQLSLKQTQPYRPESERVFESQEFKGLEAHTERPELIVFEFNLPKILKDNKCVLHHNQEDKSKAVLLQTSRRQNLFICQYSIKLTPIFEGKSSQFISIPLYLYNDGETKPLPSFSNSSGLTDQELELSADLSRDHKKHCNISNANESFNLCSEECSPLSPTKLGLLKGENTYLAFKFMDTHDDIGQLNTDRVTETNPLFEKEI